MFEPPGGTLTEVSSMTLVAHAEVREKVRELFALHLDSSWNFRYDHARKRAGTCNFATKTITLSKYIRRLPMFDIEQTLLHEIAHALAGSAAGHGPKWKRIAHEIGYVGGRTTDFSLVADHEAPWVGHCPSGHRFVRFRRPSTRASCRACHRGFSEAHEINWIYQR